MTIVNATGNPAVDDEVRTLARIRDAVRETLVREAVGQTIGTVTIALTILLAEAWMTAHDLTWHEAIDKVAEGLEVLEENFDASPLH